MKSFILRAFFQFSILALLLPGVAAAQEPLDISNSFTQTDTQMYTQEEETEPGPPLFIDISTTNPVMGQTVTITGLNLHDPDYIVVIYPLDAVPSEDFHQPLLDYWDNISITFRVGSVSKGGHLQSGKSYTINLMENGTTLNNGVNFTVGKKMQDGVVMSCTDNDEYDDHYLKGKVTYGEDFKYDYCDEAGIELIQVYCSGTATIAKRDPVTCQYGCVDGVCLQRARYHDVPVDDWYSDAVNFLTDRGIVSGYKNADGLPTGYYSPHKALLRTEALKIMLESTGKGKKVGGVSENMKCRNTWADEYCAQAEELKLQLFMQSIDPLKPITRAEVAGMMTDLFNLKEMVPEKEFADLSETHPAYKTIGAVLNAGYMRGDDEKATFRPDDTLTRAEMAIIAYRMIVKDEKAVEEGTTQEQTQEQF